MSSNTELRVKVLYDFQSQPGSGELTIQTDEILTVTRQDVGEGWWEGLNSKGESGLFPAGYVETISSMPVPSFPPPLPPPRQPEADNDDDIAWGDDDWDDDDSQTSAAPSELPQQNSHSMYTSTGVHSTISLPSATQAKQQSVRKSYNRFSTFVKSGGEDYILGTKNKSVSSDNCVYIVQDSNGDFCWAANSDREYTIHIASPEKESKLKGLKSFIAYKLTPSFNNLQVSRRYKHFDWLHGRLEEKFISIPIPPLPDKQISGRYQQAFIDHRMIQLQMWVNRITRHPVLSQCDVWMHFITCTADEKRWKTGKRRAERDEFVGASFYFSIQPPNIALEVTAVEKQTDNFSRFALKMDDAVRNLQTVAQEECKKYSSQYKKDYSKLANAFQQLEASFAVSGQQEGELTQAFKHTSNTYEAIAKLFEDQPKHDFEPLCDVLHEYKGMLAAWPDILQIHKGALNRKKENLKLQEEGKIDASTAASVAKRADVVSFATLAEMSHFHDMRKSDFKLLMQNLLTSQIQLYQNVVSHLQEALSMYNY
ncbi:sorting nexin lst-4-like protein [Leptotrombidium deliense]|uniref:Sorting nexin lst-4-like protein n=1 Tax=Leptotrombidium deliense TaxID=299467 RepID=A0A443SLK2_9ACAR|nr:sorting nexin lst-4-like protein [Leptotrombidium deliense]